MATEQDWAAYADQPFLGTGDTLLARTPAGAGVEIPGHAFIARRVAGGPHAVIDNFGQFQLLTPNNRGWRIGNTSDGTTHGYFYIQGTTDGFVSSFVDSLVISTSGVVCVGATDFGAGTTKGFRTKASTGKTAIGSNEDGCLEISYLGAADAYTLVSFSKSGSATGSITSNSTSTSYNTTSDYRLKEDLQPLSGALDRICSLPVYDFAWKSNGERTRGFLAHEFGEIIPGGANGAKDAEREEEYEVEPARLSDVVGPDGERVAIPAVIGRRWVPAYQGIDQSKAVPDLVAAVQEMAAIIEGLRDRIAALESAH